MTRLTIYDPESPVRIVEEGEDAAFITRALDRIGVRFERWQAASRLPREADQAAILATYGEAVERLKRERGYQAADVVRLARGAANAAEMRAKFIDEHIHAEDEVRFFVEGRGAFYLHIGELVHRIVCERGDLLGVPAGARHWFDMGPDPEFTAIRLFTNPAGWVAEFTGDPIAGRLPPLES